MHQRQICFSSRGKLAGKVVLLVSFSLLTTTCRPRSTSSSVSGDRMTQKSDIKLYDRGMGRYHVEFDNSSGAFKDGEELELRWSIVNGWSNEQPKCELSGKNSSVMVRIKLDRGLATFDTQVNPVEFERCNESEAILINGIPSTTRKLSLKCQKSSDWDGARLFEGCFYRGSELVGAGRAAPIKQAASTNAMNLDNELAQTDDVINYGKVCASRLGPFPRDWSCLDGQIIPITKDGVEVPFGDHQMSDGCDRPIYLGLGDQGQCVPYARLLRLYTKKDVETIVICRRYKIGDTLNNGVVSNHIDPDMPLFQDVAVVQHNVKTGESCFFQALSNHQSDNRDLPVARIPPPDEEEIPEDIKNKYDSLPENQRPVPASEFWIRPLAPGRRTGSGSSVSYNGFQCVKCHDSDPYMHSPYVDQLNFDFTFTPSKKQRFGGERTRDNLVNPGLGKHPYEGFVDKLVPCDPGKKGDKPGQLSGSLCLFQKGGTEESFGKFSQVHAMHRRNWPNSWNIVPRQSPNSEVLDDTCVKCHRIGNINACAQWVPDSIDVSHIYEAERTEHGKSFPLTHWMPVTRPSDFMATKPECQPSGTDRKVGVGCDLDANQWEQKFRSAATKLSNCCTKARALGPDMDPNTNANFRKTCMAFPITSSPPGIGALSGTILLSHPAAIIPEGSPQNLEFSLGPAVTETKKLRHLSFRARLTHEKPGEVSVMLVRGEDKVVLFDGQKDLLYPNKSVTNFALQLDSADVADSFAGFMDKSIAGSWKLVVKNMVNIYGGKLEKVEIDLDLN